MNAASAPEITPDVKSPVHRHTSIETDHPVSVSAGQGVLANDYDPDSGGTALSATIVPDLNGPPVMLNGVPLAVVLSTLPLSKWPGVPVIDTLPFMLTALLVATP